MIDPHKQHRLGTHAMFCPTWTPHDERRRREAARARALELIGVLRRLWADRLGAAQRTLSAACDDPTMPPDRCVQRSIGMWRQWQQRAFRECGRWANEERRVRAWRV